jgi:Holliday junction resolvase RusA-like endonuclease
VISLTIYGALASMKNRRIPTKRNPYVTIPNKSAQSFARTFLEQVPRSACRCIGSLKRPLRAKVTVYYPSMRSDVDAELVFDLLQKAGVIRNDRYIREKHIIGRIDKESPRVEIEVEEM